MCRARSRLAGVSSSGRSSTSSNSTMLSISVPIAMLVTRSRMNSTTTGTWCSAIHSRAVANAACASLRIGDADRLAAEAFGDRDMVDAVDAELRRVDVLERKLHLIVHVEAALRLADQPEIGIVHDDVDVGQLELRADRELLDQELEVVVARQRDDLAGRIGGAHAERGGQRPAERAGLPGIDPVARTGRRRGTARRRSATGRSR